MQALTPGDGQDIAARFERAHTSRDPNELLDLVAEHVEYHPDPFGAPLRGRIEVRAYWNDIVERRTAVTFEIERVWVVARTVLCSWHGGYAGEGTPGRVAAAGFLVVDLDDEGLIGRVREWPLTD